MAWRELKLTASLLHENGLGVLSVWSPNQNMVPQVVYIRWQHPDPSQHEMRLAEHYVMAHSITHIDPSENPKGCPWA